MVRSSGELVNRSGRGERGRVPFGIGLRAELLGVKEHPKDNVLHLLFNSRMCGHFELHDVDGCKWFLYRFGPLLPQHLTHLLRQHFSILVQIHSRGCAMAKLALVVDPLGEDHERYVDVVVRDHPWKFFHFPHVLVHRLAGHAVHSVSRPIVAHDKPQGMQHVEAPSRDTAEFKIDGEDFGKEVGMMRAAVAQDRYDGHNDLGRARSQQVVRREWLAHNSPSRAPSGLTCLLPGTRSASSTKPVHLTSSSRLSPPPSTLSPPPHSHPSLPVA